jgi:tRNA pseudouridine38-40 synthase
MADEGDAKREREDAADAAAADEAPSPKAARATEEQAADAPAAAPATDARAPREWPHGKKRKVVVLFGYVGAGYQGMQRNPGARTIEDELERAFYAAGGISDENMGDFSKARARSGSRRARRGC